jgi:hypothetical protein
MPSSKGVFYSKRGNPNSVHEGSKKRGCEQNTNARFKREIKSGVISITPMPGSKEELKGDLPHYTNARFKRGIIRGAILTEHQC